jgi:regulator of protease activity HflC (stomatin/prohibitin superfamily)
MDFLSLVVAVLAVALIILAGQQFWPSPVIIRDYEAALRYRRGHLIGLLGPGRYWIRRRFEEVVVVDTRRRQSVIAGQEVLTSDRVPLKISLIAEFTVVDAAKSITTVDRYTEVLYGRVQLALRETVAGRDLDTALAERGQLGAAITDLVRESALEFGVELHSVQIRDFMLAGGLRDAYANVVQAKQLGLASLERARGESAAIRNLANSAELMERHPGLMQLRLLQAVESGSGNRIVIALDPARGKSTEVEISAEGDV